MSSSPNNHDIQLTATRTGNRVTISGNGGADLPKFSGAHRFNFTLIDATNPKLDVAFSTLDAADNISTCPPPPGENSDQIVAVRIAPQDASFTDRNDNSGSMNVSYQWNFTCKDPNVRVIPFDPIIRNGGGGP